MARICQNIIMLAAVFVISPACTGGPKQHSQPPELIYHGASSDRANDRHSSIEQTGAIPAANARIVYVSDSHGDDSTAKVYSTDDPEVGADPRDPQGPINAFKTFTAAYRHIRAGESDWILVKRGDTFYGSPAAYSGSSPARDVVANATQSPRL